MDLCVSECMVFFGGKKLAQDFLLKSTLEKPLRIFLVGSVPKDGLGTKITDATKTRTTVGGKKRGHHGIA